MITDSTLISVPLGQGRLAISATVVLLCADPSTAIKIFIANSLLNFYMVGDRTASRT